MTDERRLEEFSNRVAKHAPDWATHFRVEYGDVDSDMNVRVKITYASMPGVVISSCGKWGPL